jgi:hypothetical protein
MEEEEMTVKTEGCVKVRTTRPWMRFKGFKVLIASRHFADFAGSNNWNKTIVVSPRFLKLPKDLQMKVLDHEVTECLYFDKKLDELGQAAHRYATYQTNFPNYEFSIRVGKKPDWYRELMGLIPDFRKR